MLVHCNGHNDPEAEGCGNTWDFQSRVDSTRLKRSYWVKCPACRAKVFYRRKRKHVEAKRG